MVSKSKKSSKSKSFRNAKDALAEIERLYAENVAFLRDSFDQFAKKKLKAKHVTAYYPYIEVDSRGAKRADNRLSSYGFVGKPGVYQSTVTRPDIFGHYYQEQMALLIKNHGSVSIGLSDVPMPLHFALGEDFHLEKDLSIEQMEDLPELFDQPDIDLMDDQVANGTYIVRDGQPAPLSLFTASRVDLSIMRLKHYTGTNGGHFQNYVIFTNYQFYIDEFVKIAYTMMAEGRNDKEKAARQDYVAFVEPGNKVTTNKNISAKARGEKDDDGYLLRRMPQMPAYHLKRKDGSGITMVNIGVGPSNAKTITDHVAVLRPHAWLMLGHCAGLRNSQSLGDYVLAHAYLREDNVLYRDLHPSIPLPALSEIQLSLEQAVEEVTGFKGYDLKKIMRTGTVATVDDRNWELRSSVRQNIRFSQSRAIALDMESGTVAANGFRFRVPYGTLLCVSDKPLHGQLKLPGMADSFYRERVEQHLKIGLRTMEILRGIGPEKLHSRKLRSFNEVAFQ
jgi:AMP nucleosidase